MLFRSGNEFWKDFDESSSPVQQIETTLQYTSHGKVTVVCTLTSAKCGPYSCVNRCASSAKCAVNLQGYTVYHPQLLAVIMNYVNGKLAAVTALLWLQRH